MLVSGHKHDGFPRASGDVVERKKTFLPSSKLQTCHDDVALPLRHGLPRPACSCCPPNSSAFIPTPPPASCPGSCSAKLGLGCSRGLLPDPSGWRWGAIESLPSGGHVLTPRRIFPFSTGPPVVVHGSMIIPNDGAASPDNLCRPVFSAVLVTSSRTGSPVSC